MEITPLFALAVFIVAFVAGLLGSLTGLGGGLILTPILVLFLGVPLEYVLGASLISTIATSNGAGSSYLRSNLSNMRIGMSLQVGTTAGAIAGSLTLYLLQELNLLYLITIIFGVVLLFSTFPNFARLRHPIPPLKKPDYYSEKLKLSGTYHDEALHVDRPYVGTRYPLGLAGMFVAGFMSGLLGIGSGAFKVLAMDFVMALPFKVSTATSIFMIGVTAATSVGLYWSFGFIVPILVAPAIPGVLLGALVGSRYLNRIVPQRLREIFTLVLIAFGIELILRGLGFFP
jgi:uncharacterized protein